MKATTRLGAIVWLLACIGAGEAAANVTTTFRGVVTSGYDLAGRFGAPSLNLSGDRYTIVFFVDESIASQKSFGATESFNEGGPSINYLYPSAVSATITIAGVTVPVDGKLGGIYVQDYPSSFLAARTDSFDPVTSDTRSMNDGILSLTDVFTTTADYRTPLKHKVQADDATFGRYSDYTTVQLVDLVLAPTSVTVVVGDQGPPAIPEPRTWSMLLAGLFVAGGALRARQRQPAAG
jgi:hypothetical protein